MKKRLLLIFAASILSAQGHSATLTWSDIINPSGTTWNVYRAPGLCTASPVFSKLASAIGVKTYIDPTVTPGSYCYAVSATLQGTESALSVPAQASVPPSAPTLVSVAIQ